MKKYRYRDRDETIQQTEQGFRHIEKLGRIRYVKGYRYEVVMELDTGDVHGDQAYGPVTKEAVLVVGEQGSARFNLLWGFNGDEPRALVRLLVRLGIHQARAENIGFNFHRHDTLGVDCIAGFKGDRLHVITREQAEGIEQRIPALRQLSLFDLETAE